MSIKRGTMSQNLSEKFIKEFEDEIDVELYKRVHQKKSRQQKIKEIKKYAEKYNLTFDGRYLFAFRTHDFCGRGSFNKAMFYEKGKYYRDWGVALNTGDGKARVWGFTVL